MNQLALSLLLFLAPSFAYASLEEEILSRYELTFSPQNLFYKKVKDQSYQSFLKQFLTRAEKEDLGKRQLPPFIRFHLWEAKSKLKWRPPNTNKILVEIKQVKPLVKFLKRFPLKKTVKAQDFLQQDAALRQEILSQVSAIQELGVSVYGSSILSGISDPYFIDPKGEKRKVFSKTRKTARGHILIHPGQLHFSDLQKTLMALLDLKDRIEKRKEKRSEVYLTEANLLNNDSQFYYKIEPQPFDRQSLRGIQSFSQRTDHPDLSKLTSDELQLKIEDSYGLKLKRKTDVRRTAPSRRQYQRFLLTFAQTAQEISLPKLVNNNEFKILIDSYPINLSRPQWQDFIDYRQGEVLARYLKIYRQ